MKSKYKFILWLIIAFMLIGISFVLFPYIRQSKLERLGFNEKEEMPFISETKHIIVSAAECAKARYSMYHGLGSYGVTVRGIRDGKCVVTRTIEIEMGSSTEICQIPVNAGSILLSVSGWVENPTAPEGARLLSPEEQKQFCEKY